VILGFGNETSYNQKVNRATSLIGLILPYFKNGDLELNGEWPINKNKVQNSLDHKNILKVENISINNIFLRRG